MSNPSTPVSPSQAPLEQGGGWPVVRYWAENLLQPSGPALAEKIFHPHACKSCAWGTKGFRDELGRPLQRCAKGIEAEIGDLQDPTAFHQTHTISQLAQLTPYEAEHLGRLSQPLLYRAGDDRYQPIGWEAVYDLITQSLSSHAPHQAGSYSSGRGSNEAAFALQLMMRQYGSPHLADCSDLCHVPSTRGLSRMFGTGTSQVELADLHKCSCVVLAGSHAAANHPRLMNELIEVRQRGGVVIVLNPVREVGLIKFATPAKLGSLLYGSEIASLYLQPHPGSDAAVFIGIQKWLLEHDRVDRAFLVAHTLAWEAVIHQAEETPWDAILATCGLSFDEIATAAQLIADHAGETIFAWAMGITQQANGVDNVTAIANTALLTGSAGKPGTGLMPIRGHSNVQGFGSMGVSSHLRDSLREGLEKLVGRPLSRDPGYSARRLMRAAAVGEVKTLLCLGGNLYGANPDLQGSQAALAQIDTIVYLATKPNPGHFNGLAARNTLLLPVLARGEEAFATTVESGNNFVRLNQPGRTHLNRQQVLSEFDIICTMAQRLLGTDPVDWSRMRDPDYIRSIIAAVIPGYGEIEDISHSQRDFTIDGRIIHSIQWPTPSGKATLFPVSLPDLRPPCHADVGRDPASGGQPFLLITGRAYGQHNTVVYKDADPYRGMPHRHCLLISPEDAQAHGFSPGQRVTVHGTAGSLAQIEVCIGPIKPGSIFMVYPEANALIRPAEDPLSDIPAYKRSPVVVVPET